MHISVYRDMIRGVTVNDGPGHTVQDYVDGMRDAAGQWRPQL